MKKILLGTTLLFGLAGPAFATDPVNTIAIDDGLGSVQTLSIDQSAATGGTVSSDGTNASSGTPAALAIKGPWDSIAITQSGAGNTFQGTSIKSGGSTGSATVAASYTTTVSGGTNVHQLNIGAITAPTDPSVTVNVSNNGASANTITDTFNGSALAYNLAITGTGNTLTNAVKATGAVTLTQGGGGHGITGDSNTIDNEIGGTAAVTSFTQALTVTGDSNAITNTVNSSGAKTVNQSVVGSNNVSTTTVSGGGTQVANLGLTGSWVDYAIKSAANSSSADVSLSGVGGSSGSPDIVRVEQTSGAGGATAVLTVAGGGNTMGNLGSYGGTYGASGAGVAVYQNTSGAYLNASVTGAANGYTAIFKQ